MADLKNYRCRGRQENFLQNNYNKYSGTQYKVFGGCFPNTPATTDPATTPHPPKKITCDESIYMRLLKLSTRKTKKTSATVFIIIFLDTEDSQTPVTTLPYIYFCLVCGLFGKSRLEKIIIKTVAPNIKFFGGE